jgi:hypothetical protein
MHINFKIYLLLILAIKITISISRKRLQQRKQQRQIMDTIQQPPKQKRIIFYIGDKLSHNNILFTPKTKTNFISMNNKQFLLASNTSTNRKQPNIPNISVSSVNIRWTGSFIIDYGTFVVDYILCILDSMF